jgi:hypothetical protein
MPHDNGVITEEAEAADPPSDEKVRQAVAALSAFPSQHVLTYANTLWLQDPGRWAALEHAADWAAT